MFPRHPKPGELRRRNKRTCPSRWRIQKRRVDEIREILEVMDSNCIWSDHTDDTLYGMGCELEAGPITDKLRLWYAKLLKEYGSMHMAFRLGCAYEVIAALGPRTEKLRVRLANARLGPFPRYKPPAILFDEEVRKSYDRPE